MPDLNFRITDVKPAFHGMTPLLNFQLEIENSSNEPIRALVLNAQIQIETPKRGYTLAEKERLSEVFGTPERWSQTLRNKLWTQAHQSFGRFDKNISVTLAVPCTFDLNVLATKYFYALQDGDVPLLFLFSGSIFYTDSEGRFQVHQIPWDKESTFRFPVNVWKELMNSLYPNSKWLYLHNDLFDKLYAYKRQHGHVTWDDTIDHLLRAEETEIASTTAA